MAKKPKEEERESAPELDQGPPPEPGLFDVKEEVPSYGDGLRAAWRDFEKLFIKN